MKEALDTVCGALENRRDPDDNSVNNVMRHLWRGQCTDSQVNRLCVALMDALNQSVDPRLYKLMNMVAVTGVMHQDTTPMPQSQRVLAGEFFA